MKLSDYLIRFLEEQRIRYVFGFIGGAITHIVDSAYKSNQVRFIQTYHEQSAAIAAEGYSRISNGPGVAMATSGPGATNLITGIADAYLDSIPVVYITGQVNTYEFKYTKPIRQQGFQETDIVSIVKPVTKYAEIINEPEKIRYYLEKAFHICKSGRPGPVLLDIPMNIQKEEINPDELKGFEIKEEDSSNEEASGIIKGMSKEIVNSKRPLILAGGGIIISKAEKQLQDFANKNKIPVVNSLMGKGSFPEDSPLHVGMIGSYGNRCANIVLANADLLIAIGTRLDTRQTGTILGSFLREGKIIQVDIDQNELKFHRLEKRIWLQSDANEFLKKLNRCMGNEKNRGEWNDWLEYVKKVKSRYNQNEEVKSNVENKLPYKLIEQFNKIFRKDQVFCIDTGQNQMFAAQTLDITNGQRFLTSGGLAPMGYAIPAAVGASFGSEKQREVIAITGDGGFHIALQSLMLISQYDLPVKVVILNNRTLGMITQFQDLYFDKKRVATTKGTGYFVPGIKEIAQSYNLKYYLIDEKRISDLEYLKKVMTGNKNGIFEVLTGDNTKVVPKLEVGDPIEDTSPKLDRKELEDVMLIKAYKT